MAAHTSPIFRPEVFCGFEPDQLDTLAQRARRTEQRSHLSSVTVTDAYAALLSSSSPVMHGGILDSKGALVSASRVVRGSPERAVVGHPAQQLPRDPVVVNEPAVYGGVIFHHFGHFLLESITRLWDVDSQDSRRVFFHAQTPMPAFALPILTSLGLDRIEIIDRPLLFRQIDVPEPSFVIRRAWSEDFRSTCLRAAPSMQPTRQEPIYLSRRRYRRSDGRAQRILIDEEHLEVALAAAGCRIFYPEQHTFAEQLQIIGEHSTVMGPVGSAMHLVNFLPGSRTVVYFTGSVPNVNFLLGDAMNASHAVYIKGFRQPRVIDYELRNTLNYPWLVDVERIIDALVRRGILSSTSAAIRRASSASMDDYRAAWRAALPHWDEKYIG